MAIYVKPGWRKYIPHLNMFVSFPLIKVETMLFYENLDMLTFTYVGLYWRIWKWEGRIRLFETDNRFHSEYVREDDVARKRCGCWISKKYSLKYYCKKHFKI